MTPPPNEIVPDMVPPVSGRYPDTLLKALCTNAVVAICVVLVPEVAVGAVGVPNKLAPVDEIDNSEALFTNTLNVRPEATPHHAPPDD